MHATLPETLFAITLPGITSAAAQELSILVWALAHLRAAPPPSWVRAFFQASQPSLQHFNAQVSVRAHTLRACTQAVSSWPTSNLVCVCVPLCTEPV